MTKIDEATGMAALPEDMFWKVEQECVGVGFDAISVDTVRILLMQRYTEVSPSYTVTELVKADGLRGFFGETKRVEKVIPERSTPELRIAMSGSLLEKSYDKPKNSSGWMVRTVSGYYGTQKLYYRITPCTKDSLRDLSVRTWNAYIDECHERAITMDSKMTLKNFLGSYPPKSLNLVEA